MLLSFPPGCWSSSKHPGGPPASLSHGHFPTPPALLCLYYLRSPELQQHRRTLQGTQRSCKGSAEWRLRNTGWHLCRARGTKAAASSSMWVIPAWSLSHSGFISHWNKNLKQRTRSQPILLQTQNSTCCFPYFKILGNRKLFSTLRTVKNKNDFNWYSRSILRN